MVENEMQSARMRPVRRQALQYMYRNDISASRSYMTYVGLGMVREGPLDRMNDAIALGIATTPACRAV